MLEHVLQIAQWQCWGKKISQSINWLTKIIVNTNNPQNMGIITEWPRLLGRPWVSPNPSPPVGTTAHLSYIRKAPGEVTCDLEVCPPSGDCSVVPPRWRSAEQTVPGSVLLGLGEETRGSNRHHHHQLERQNKNSRHPNLEIRMYFLTRKIKFEEIFLWFYELSYQGKFKQLNFVKNYSELKNADTIESRVDVVAYWLFLKESIKVFQK